MHRVLSQMFPLIAREWYPFGIFGYLFFIYEFRMCLYPALCLYVSYVRVFCTVNGSSSGR